MATDVLGKSGREMIEVLISGERDPAVLGDMARTRMSPTIPELRFALENHFGGSR
ncbi:MAG: hypothetical protein ACRDX8_14635 [Acidimicrobiales bacterium]